jgi:hypothetical protein
VASIGRDPTPGKGGPPETTPGRAIPPEKGDFAASGEAFTGGATDAEVARAEGDLGAGGSDVGEVAVSIPSRTGVTSFPSGVRL